MLIEDPIAHPKITTLATGQMQKTTALCFEMITSLPIQVFQSISYEKGRRETMNLKMELRLFKRVLSTFCYTK